jgi:hypothetical protein
MSNSTGGPFAAEVQTGGDSNFYGNALRFPTLEAASLYVQDLFCRWTSVRSWRVVQYVPAGWGTVKVVVQVKS